VALAAAALLSVPTFDAQALALGRVTVQSALGEPLRVDIDLPEISAEEVSSLQAVIASPAAFQSAGMDYNPALANVRVAVQRRPDGSYFLRLSGDRPINEPFVDVVLETTWSSGRIRRDFTMLFDPPALRQGQQPLTAQATPVAPGAVEKRAAPAQAPGQQRNVAPGAVARAPAATPPSPAPASKVPAGKGEGSSVTVQAGDTAGKIAAANKPTTVSLDQMLVAMLRSNPDAFASGNINRLRAGTVLNLPSQQQAEAVTPADAHETLVAQSRDFNEFRRKLAESLPAAPTVGTERESRGKVQAQVDEKKPSTGTPDKLTLSKGALQGKGGEDKIARDRSSQASASRVAELNRNMADLQGLTAAATASKPGASAPAAAGGKPAGPALPLGTPAATAARPASAPVAAAATPVKPASAPAAAAPVAPTTPAPVTASAASAPKATAPVATASAPAATASAPVATASAPVAAASAPAAAATRTAASSPVATTARATPAAAAKKPAAAPVAEPGLVDQIIEEPLIPGAIGAAVLALLAVFGWRARQRRQATAVDSSFLESRLQPDSFFGASGGQRVDTNEGTPSGGSSMVYSPSQLDAAGDVDPVAEADVYLAYGRDLQAEEILKEALRINPQRAAIHVKLLEIYAKRRDAKAFEHVATEAYALTHGDGSEWARICELGQELDPGNPMYKPGGHPTAGGAARATAVAAAAPAASFLTTSKQPVAEPPPADSGVDLDLDLDFSAGDEPAPTATAPAPIAPVAQPAPPVTDALAKTQSTQAVQFDAPELTLSDNSLDFESFTTPAPAPTSAPAAAAPAPAAPDAGMIEFDMGALSLDLGPSATPPPPKATRAPAPAEAAPMEPVFLDVNAPESDDPLATKLALAEEFNAIGDADGARSLAQEVIAEASGDLKSKAQKFLAEIG
jgi:pilus assembly protein FimV